MLAQQEPTYRDIEWVLSPGDLLALVEDGILTARQEHQPTDRDLQVVVGSWRVTKTSRECHVIVRFFCNHLQSKTCGCCQPEV